ncbi:hypothetical protein [Mesorhizobium sp. M5C.F.Ca.IN.020.32.2.1]|uniref:hypothetical protein n=1 Tax=Mesorhizobium sp. M5C.F.Ca.IN.020.32.2.1 TaxID=2496771 RepID=UPI000FD2EB5D|nr:hypothetical protein [Mesorhizobium sp. M5C.F.Ca.IN.020.32.2.1]RUV32467.1 hypothetical protein EOA86_02345 [Mesorhizobium sp. M5C.F.Ca.IN.020.32.2.1]
MAGAIFRRHLLSRPILLLRRMEEQKPGSLPPALLPRLTYLSLEPYKNSRPRDAYSTAVAARIRRAARKQVVEAARRIVLGDDLPRPPADLHPTIKERFQQLVEGIARDGWAMSKEPLFDSMRQRAIYHGAPRRKDLSCAAVHACFYLTATDVVAFIILISLGTGMEIECLRTLKAECLKNPARGFVDIAYFKRRAHGTEWKTMRVRDGGVMTPGGLLRLAIRLTERARKRLGSDRLWVWGCLTGLIDGMTHGSLAARYFVRDHCLLDDQGNVLRLELSRLRKTYKAAWYVKTGGQLETFAQGHSVEVAAQHYADIPALRHVHEATIAAALNEALATAQPNEPRILIPAQEAAIRRDPDDADLPAAIVTRDVVPLFDGAQDVWLAACANFYDSPFGKADQACPSPFWACLDCRNAVITARKLPALIAFMNFTLEQRGLLASEDWEAKFGRAWRRINDQILPAFPRSVVEAARKSATADLLYLPPEAGAP